MRTPMLFVPLAIAGLLAACQQRDTGDSPVTHSTAASAPVAPVAPDDDRLQTAIRTHARDAQVTGSGVVDRVLADDRDGSRHQRFILRLGRGQTLLVAHNIDLAPRLESLDPGERVDFEGEYEWTERGGVVHWTHHDPAGRHPGGWLRHEGRTVR